MGLEKEMLVCVRFDWVCSVRLGLLVRIAGFVVVGLIGDHFWTFGVWGLLKIWFCCLLGISHFAISFCFLSY